MGGDILQRQPLWGSDNWTKPEWSERISCAAIYGKNNPGRGNRKVKGFKSWKCMVCSVNRPMCLFNIIDIVRQKNIIQKERRTRVGEGRTEGREKDN